jgi:hypothetical protein
MMSNPPLATTPHDLIDDLYVWGPALTVNVRAKYPLYVIQILMQAQVISRVKFTGFEVYMLTGKGLRPYGYMYRYNYVPARNTVVGAIMLRAKAEELRLDGYTVEAYHGYASHGRANLALMTKDAQTSVLITRVNITMRAVQSITAHFAKPAQSALKVSGVQIFVLPVDRDTLLLNAKRSNGLTVQATEVPLTSVTRAHREKEYGPADSANDPDPPTDKPSTSSS